MRYLIGDQQTLLFLTYSYADIPNYGRTNLISFDKLSAETYLNSKFRAVIAPSLNLPTCSHRTSCRSVGCKEAAMMFSMLVLKAYWDEGIDRAPKHFR